MPLSPSPELLVVALSVLLVLVLVALTVGAQLQAHPATLLRVWRAASSRLCARQSGSWRTNLAESSTTPGKKARRTQRRRERRSAMRERHYVTAQGSSTSSDQAPAFGSNPPSVELSYRRYEDQLHQESQSQRESLRGQLQTLRDHTPHTPCSGCRIVNAKKSCSYNCCASCCRNQSSSVCRVHGTGYQAAVASVEGAVCYGHREFDLSYGHLRMCPPAISAIGTQLVSLNLSNNRLVSLPEDVGTLSSLHELFLQYNNLTLLPDSVCNLHLLQELDTKNNRLVQLPRNIGMLRRLVILNVTNNQLTSLPASIERLGRLEELGLHSNQLTRLPDEICNLASLQVLYGGDNRFKSLPEQFGRLRKLQELDVSGCELEVLPESLSQCVSIVRLWLSSNRLQTLPIKIGNLCQIKELHVRHNRLRSLPASIEKLQPYTFTAQNNNFVNERTVQSMCHTPRDPIPPLLELSGRAVLRNGITWNTGSIPNYLRDMLLHPSWCSVCGGPFFEYYLSQVTFKTIGVFYRVPLHKHLCLPHLGHRDT